jgi:hypothetical protein
MNEGKKDRRDPIRAVKPRNFVAKNAVATTSGAGAHKDKKKAMKQGDVKHKKQEYAEHLNQSLKTALVKEEFDAEYDDEAGMSHNSLKTIHRAAVGLMDTIQDGDNLPEWCQEKISIAEDYLITVWDYLQSEQSVAETALNQKDPKGDYTAKRKALHDLSLNKDVDQKAVQQRKLDLDKEAKSKGVAESWTHDTLAAQLFETENTYEEKLNNALNRKLGK